ncbi:ATP-grasp domain-containing protein [Foetidibacter luteolus]|uniref:ATP-grasp domain-containing protein n=1 Tax=Foetidibacter luteolus TaxID=2608880 RepID=UPI00129BD895|nr:ATP-grasp domain-containing protein [Foetidibacter luteolus]
MHLYTEKLIKGHFSNISFYTAIEAFYNMGFEIHEVSDFDGLKVKDDNIFLGSISFIHQALSLLKINIPLPFDYPDNLHEFYGRKIYSSTISHVSNNPSMWNVFIKPKGVLKQFSGRVVRGTADLIGTSNYEFDTPIWVSEPVNFVAEWRAFVRYGEVLDVRRYKGHWKYGYDHKVIEAAVKAFCDAPKAYALDFGLTADGRLLVVEANEGHSIGSYGLFYVDYAKLISTRWCELTGQKDLCDF